MRLGYHRLRRLLQQFQPYSGWFCGCVYELDPRWERLGYFACRPVRRSLELLDCPGVIDVNDRIELPCKIRIKVVALSLRFRSIDDADRAFEQRTVTGCANGAIVENVGPAANFHHRPIPR